MQLPRILMLALMFFSTGCITQPVGMTAPVVHHVRDTHDGVTLEVDQLARDVDVQLQDLKWRADAWGTLWSAGHSQPQ